MQFNLLTSNTYFNAFEMVLSKLKQNSLEVSVNNIVIVPDKFVLNAEREIFKKLGIESTFNIEVLTFSRLANKVIDKDLNKTKVLSKQSGIMLINKLILNNAQKLKAFSKATKLVGFAETIFKTIKQLKSCNITPEEFLKSYKGENKALSLKIADISLIYQDYENYLQNTYIDSTNKLTLLNAEVKNSQYIQNANVYFAMFDGFTSQNYDIIESMTKYAKSVNVGFVSNINQPNKNLYSSNMYNGFRLIEKKLNIKANIINEEANLKPEFDYIANNLYALNTKPFVLNSNALELFEANNIVEEVEYVASKIKQRVMEEGFRYKNFNIALGNMESYSNIIKEVFNKYDIPFFINESIALTEHIYIKFLLSSLKLVIRNFAVEEVLSYTKNYFFGVQFEKQNIFEDMALKYGISNDGFFNELSLSKVDKNIETYEKVRKQFAKQFEVTAKEFKKCIKIEDYCHVIEKFLSELEVEGKLNVLEEEYKKSGNINQQKLTSQVFDKVDNLLKELKTILGKEELCLVEFYNILENGLNSISVSIIPISVDSVFVEDANNINFTRRKNLFVLGMAEGDVPVAQMDCGIILDDDIKNIASKNKLEPSIKELNLKSKFNFFQLLLMGTDYLNLSYAITQADNTEKKPALVLKGVQKLFVKNIKDKELSFNTLYEGLTDESLSTINMARAYGFYYVNKELALEKLIKELRNIKDGNETLSLVATSSLYSLLEEKYGREFFKNINDLSEYKNDIAKIENAKTLFFGNERTKISQLERYFDCPFKHFVDYGLKLKEREVSMLRALDFGTILHAVAEQFGMLIKQEKASEWNNLEEVASLIINKILKNDSYKFIVENKENANLINSLKEEATRLVKAIYYADSKSDFKIAELEFRFGLEDVSTGLKLVLDKKELNFGGVIDRVDFYEKHFRVIDYKTGKSSFSFKDLYLGKKIQLFIYSRVVGNLTGKKPAGTFYFPIKNEFKEKKQEGRYSLYKLEGALLENIGIIKAMDTTLSLLKPTSQLVHVKFSTAKAQMESGEIVLNKTSTTKNLLEESDFKVLEDYALEVSKKAGNEIIEGYINASPSEDSKQYTACTYCEYRGICKFDKEFGNKTRKLENGSLKKEQIKGAIING